jgi:hypothetical protein
MVNLLGEWNVAAGNYSGVKDRLAADENTLTDLLTANRGCYVQPQTEWVLIPETAVVKNN